jgi:hypothetical protein
LNPLLAERVDDLWETFVERFLVARKQRDRLAALNGNAAITIGFDSKVHFSPAGSAVTGLHCIG